MDKRPERLLRLLRVKDRSEDLGANIGTSQEGTLNLAECLYSYNLME